VKLASAAVERQVTRAVWLTAKLLLKHEVNYTAYQRHFKRSLRTYYSDLARIARAGIAYESFRDHQGAVRLVKATI